jgi:hypothetical protein
VAAVLAASSAAFIPRTTSWAGGMRKWEIHEDIRSSTRRGRAADPSMPSSAYSPPTAAMAASSMWVTSRGGP